MCCPKQLRDVCEALRSKSRQIPRCSSATAPQTYRHEGRCQHGCFTECKRGTEHATVHGHRRMQSNKCTHVRNHYAHAWAPVARSMFRLRASATQARMCARKHEVTSARRHTGRRPPHHLTQDHPTRRCRPLHQTMMRAFATRPTQMRAADRRAIRRVPQCRSACGVSFPGFFRRSLCSCSSFFTIRFRIFHSHNPFSCVSNDVLRVEVYYFSQSVFV